MVKEVILVPLPPPSFPLLEKLPPLLYLFTDNIWCANGFKYPPLRGG